jgi:hypothetical protein
MKQSPEERKIFLAELNEIACYTAKVLHGEEVSLGRIKQYKKYFNRTFNMLNRISVLQGDINNNSFRFGYGGKLLVRKVMLELGFIKKNGYVGKKAIYVLLIHDHEITLELVSRIIVEVYLARNEIGPI